MTVYGFKMLPFDPVRTEESVTVATQTKIHFDMLRKRMSLPDDKSQFKKHKEFFLVFFEINIISTY